MYLIVKFYIDTRFSNFSIRARATLSTRPNGLRDNKTYYVRLNTFSPYNYYIRTKSSSYIKVSFSILNRLLLLTLGFNSLGLSGDVPLTSLTIILPRRSLILVLILNN